MNLNCPYCGDTIAYDASQAGQSFLCSYCQKPIRMPAFEDLPEELQEELRREAAKKEEMEKRKERRKERQLRKDLEKQARQNETTELQCVICECFKTFKMTVFDGATSCCPHCGQSVVATRGARNSAELEVFASGGSRDGSSRLSLAAAQAARGAAASFFTVWLMTTIGSFGRFVSPWVPPCSLGAGVTLIGISMLCTLFAVASSSKRRRLVSFPASELRAVDRSHKESGKKT